MAVKFIDMYEFPVKTFYWALSTDFVFKEMPDLTKQHDALVDSDQDYFLGEPGKVLSGKKEGDEEEEEEAKEEPDEDEEDGEGDVKAKDSDETSEEEI